MKKKTPIKSTRKPTETTETAAGGRCRRRWRQKRRRASVFPYPYPPRHPVRVFFWKRRRPINVVVARLRQSRWRSLLCRLSEMAVGSSIAKRKIQKKNDDDAPGQTSSVNDRSVSRLRRGPQRRPLRPRRTRSTDDKKKEERNSGGKKK